MTIATRTLKKTLVLCLPGTLKYKINVHVHIFYDFNSSKAERGRPKADRAKRIFFSLAIFYFFSQILDIILSEIFPKKVGNRTCTFIRHFIEYVSTTTAWKMARFFYSSNFWAPGDFRLSVRLVSHCLKITKNVSSKFLRNVSNCYHGHNSNW